MTLQYLVCATPRCGSGLLCDALRSTGVAGDPQEWFARGVVHQRLGDWGIRAPESSWDAPAMVAGGDYATRVRAAATQDGVFSLKLHWNQWELFAGTPILPGLPSLTGVLDDAARAIVIRRRDVVAQAVSGLVAQSTKVFFRRRGEVPRPTMEFSHLSQVEPVYDYIWLLDQAITILEHEANWGPFLAEHGLPSHQVWYEDLVDDLPGSCAGMLDFLGLSGGREPEPELERQADETNQALIDRFRGEFADSEAARVLPPAVLARFRLD